MNKNINKTEQTKYDIKCAFLQLLETKKFEDITVREISDLSGYHRSTFYLYFKNVNDVLWQVEKDLLDDFRDFLRAELTRVQPRTIDDFVRVVVYALRSRHRPDITQPIFLLMGDNGDHAFLNALKSHIKENMADLEQVNKMIDDDEKDYLIEFFASGAIAIVKKWFENGMNIPIEQAVSYLVKYSLAVINA